jgi:hypothetical protein
MPIYKRHPGRDRGKGFEIGKRRQLVVLRYDN